MQEKKYLVVIPARGGSKGIPKKNIRNLNGKPLIAYTLEVAKEALAKGIVSRVLVSTDSEEIADISRNYGVDVPFMRSEALAGDEAKTVDVMLEVVDKLEQAKEYYNTLITLQPTSPQRLYADLEEAVNVYNQCNNDSLISVYEDPKANGYNYYTSQNGVGIPQKELHNKGVRRQDMPEIYVRNGAIYITDIEMMKKEKVIIGNNPQLFIMPKERSVDLDSMEDFAYLEWLMQYKKESGV